jgi:hypothetical protein
MSTLTVNPDEIARFVNAVFRNVSPDSTVSLRAFQEAGEKRPFKIATVKLEGNVLEPVIERSVQLAQQAADAPEPTVFCPVPATFKTDTNAKEENIAEAPVLCVECDSHPNSARQMLEEVLGPATIIVASGGQWTHPETGEVQDKIHLYWRLSKPAAGFALQTLRNARRLAARYVGGDPTCISAAHPMRWPGSWHRKGQPKMAKIIALNDSSEIDPNEALKKLQMVLFNEYATSENASGRAEYTDEDPRSTPELLRLISTGESFHPAIVPLAARWLGRGMHPGAVVTIRELMQEIPVEKRDSRWWSRFHDLPRIVETATAKFHRAEQAK